MKNRIFNLSQQLDKQLQIALNQQKKKRRISYMFYFSKMFILLFLHLVLLQAKNPLHCPTSMSLDIYSDVILIDNSFESKFQFDTSKSMKCYTYPLQYVFQNTPNAIVAIHQFESKTFTSLFISIRPVLIDKLAVQFQVRALWKYTIWTKLGFNFLLEDLTGLQIGFYQRGNQIIISDTGSLNSCDDCSHAKTQAIFIPFNQNWCNRKNLTIRTFLSGFQIQTVEKNKGLYTPLEVQLTSRSYNQSGIIAILSTTTSTQVNNIFISYLVFEVLPLKLVNGQVIMKTRDRRGYLIPNPGFTKLGDFLIGLTGFILNQNSHPLISLALTSNFFIQLESKDCIINYLSLQYLIFSSDPCRRCLGNPYLNNNICVATCPQNSIILENSCLPCPMNSHAQGNSCQCDENYHKVNGFCESCQPGEKWDGKKCLSCGLNAMWVGELCQCMEGFYNITGQCKRCPSNTIWNGTDCIEACKPGEFWNGQQCKDNCQTIQNSYWNGKQCICNPGCIKKGNSCVNKMGSGICLQGTYFDPLSMKCVSCPIGCSSCKSPLECYSCSRGFTNSSCFKSCSQICGDGIRFILQCDDGNTRDGDGCSSSCKIEPGFTCFGGSPNSKDLCTRARPTKIQLFPTGQSHSFGRISLNVKMNWLPNQLTQDGCKKCNSILDVVISNCSRTPQIRVNYIPGSSYSFSIQFNYNQQPIPPFTFSIGVCSSLGSSVFKGVDISQRISMGIDPATLAKKSVLNSLD